MKNESSEVGGDAAALVALRGVSLKPMRVVNVTARMHAAEFFTVACAAYVSSMLYQYGALESQFDIGEYVAAAVYLATLVSIVSMASRHFLAIRRQPLHVLLWNGMGAVALAFSFFLSTLFLLKVSTQYSRGAFVFQLVGVGVMVCMTRTMFYFWLQSAIRAGHVEARRVVLIGDERYRPQFSDLVRTTAIRSVASLPFPLHRDVSARHDDGGALVDGAAARQAIAFCRSINPDDVIILASQEELAAAPELARLLSELPVHVHIVPLGSVNVFGTSRIAELGDLKTLEVSRPPLSLFDRAIKRAFDIIVASVGIILLAPLFAAVVIAIKLESPGNIFFRQKRHGYNNTIIEVIKFRSMVSAPESDRFIQATRQDARVTRVGRILRRTNIDELPQLFNVLMGDMSIVGPRPHATVHNEMFDGKILPFSRRHNIKPGITGWAQVNGHRGETDTLEKMQRRVEHDLYYIDNWSFHLDLKIVLLTLFSKRSYTNAY
ncbi:MAG TPA: undecaprenyl-phosphate glucose phosphotransferase [Xanthobacteraceae bacterium]|jgi:Undecaprenyl-phosphate glucose phosphotransferase